MPSRGHVFLRLGRTRRRPHKGVHAFGKMNTQQDDAPRVMGASAPHYDAAYFAWQSSVGEFGGWANLTKFDAYIEPQHAVIDFGCGGGYLLKSISCREKIGIEVNEVARKHAEQMGLRIHASTAEVPDDWADAIVSNHVLEHCPCPLTELKQLLPKLRTGGRTVFVVPAETIRLRYRADDVNRHLYTWSPMALGNLFDEAGYTVEECEPYIHMWPPGYRSIARFGGRRLFDVCCQVYARYKRSGYQIRIVARRT